MEEGGIYDRKSFMPAAESLTKKELIARVCSLEERTEDLERQLEWFRRQIFGKKSEKLSLPHPKQLALGEYKPVETLPEPSVTIKSYERKKRNGIEFVDEKSLLKFDKRVPVEEKELQHPEIKDLKPDEYEVIGEEVTHRLAQRPGSYVVIRYRRKKIKVKDKIIVSRLPAPARVIEKSVAEVSFLAGLSIDKFKYHLPLYRQHKRLEAAGVHINRMTLTNLVHRTAELLEPVYRSIQSSILSSDTITMDETPLKVGKDPNKRQMKQGYLWALYGDKGELAFHFSPSRSGKVVREVLEQFEGTLLTDGYSVYEKHAAMREEVLHAQCWAHARRKFFEAKDKEPELSEKALSFITELYRLEKEHGARKREEYSKEVVDNFFIWLKDILNKHALLPSSPFSKAAYYAVKRENALRVFLSDPKLPLDTNHVERQIRPVALGRKNWMFHWTEVGAEKAAILQSIIASCELQNVDPFTYLVDVLQRIEIHPMINIHLLTPRLWKENFADNPLREALYRGEDVLQ